MKWCVEIIGDDADLNMLTESMATGATTIKKASGKFFLESEAFVGLVDTRSVTEKSKEILALISGFVHLHLDGTTSLKVGGVYRREAGGRDYVLVGKTGQYRLRGFPLTVTLTNSDGTVEIRRPADSIRSILDLASCDEAVAKALRLLGCDSKSWVGLYRLLEVIEGDISRAVIISKGWATKESIKSFRHTANSVTATGDNARHGTERNQPPARPMSLEDAQDLIDSLLKFWMTSKKKIPALDKEKYT